MLRRLIDSGAAVLLVTHDAEEALRTADDVALLRNGQVVQAGEIADVYLNPIDARAAMALGSVSVVKAHVAAGLAQSAFGTLPAAGRADGPAHVYLREEAVHLDRESTPIARVQAVRRIGPLLSVSLHLLATGEEIEAAFHRDSHLQNGDVIGLSLDQRLTWVWD
jgi:iron(III) transport system ATP-binding protein